MIFRAHRRSQVRFENLSTLLTSVLPAMSGVFDILASATAESKSAAFLYIQYAETVIIPTLAVLTKASEKDTLWKPMNHKILLATRNPNYVVRLVAVKTLHQLFQQVCI